MRGVVYPFSSYRTLASFLKSQLAEGDIALPEGVVVEEGEWVIAEFLVGDSSTCVAARGVDWGAGPLLMLEEKDVERLASFARRHDDVPACCSSLPPPSGPRAAPPHTRVLVVDDDVETQGIVRALLERAGYCTCLASTAESALERVRASSVDLVVLDWTLPGMSGLEFCKIVRSDSALSRLPIVFLTARSELSDRRAAFEAGADDFVTKPFRVPELGAKILGLLRRSAPAQAAV